MSLTMHDDTHDDKYAHVARVRTRRYRFSPPSRPVARLSVCRQLPGHPAGMVEIERSINHKLPPLRLHSHLHRRRTLVVSVNALNLLQLPSTKSEQKTDLP